eukprot:10317565-Karenia_brevis.AAC.1
MKEDTECSSDHQSLHFHAGHDASDQTFQIESTNHEISVDMDSYVSNHMLDLNSYGSALCK